MKMLKQLPSRNQRSKGLKTKHFLQACLLLAICFWLLSQLKHTYEKNVHEESARVINKVVSDNPGSVKLGRKDLHHEVDGTTSDVGIEDELVESMSEDNEDDNGGGGDDEIDGRFQEKAEEEENELGVPEDLIDVQDKDKEDELEDYEIKGYQNDDKMVIQDRGNVHLAREERHNINDVEQQHRLQTMNSHVAEN